MMGSRTAAAWLVPLLAACAIGACSGDDGAGGAPAATATPALAEAPPDGWTMLAHDLLSSFHNPAESELSADSAGRLAQAWEFTVSGSVTGAPAVAGDRLYALATGGMYALEARTGTVLWQNAGVRGTSSPAYADGKLYVNDSRSVVHRVDAETGAEDWQAPVDTHPRAAGFSSPVLAGGLVIVGSASIEEVSARENATFRGSLVAFDQETGEEVWRHYTVEPPYNGVSIWSSASVDTELGLVYATTGNNYTEQAGDTSDSVFALDLRTGTLRWNRQLSKGDVFTIPAPRSPDSDFGTNPILFEATIDGRERKLLGAGQKSGMFWVLDRETGDVVWSRRVSAGSALIGGVFNNGAFDGERIIVAGNNGTSMGAGSEPSNGASRALGAANVTTSVLMAMDPADGTVLWERQLPAWVWAPITIANGVGFVAAERQLQAFDAASGAKLFSIDTSGTVASAAAIAGGRVYFGSGVSYFGTTPDDKLHALAIP